MRLGEYKLNSEKSDWQVAARWCLAAAFVFVFCGCSSSKQASSDSIWLDAGQAGEVAVERLDANGDQFIDQAEWAKLPTLTDAFAQFDSDGDGKVAASDITGRLLRLSMSGQPLVEAECRVQLEGRPLPGASVRLKPMFVRVASSWAGEGVTDAQGIATISLPENFVPAELQGAKGIPPGVYFVEITHPEQQIPAKYNTASELGFVVDPSTRSGVSTVFDLKSK